MSFQYDVSYHFVSHGGSGKCLNVYGDEQVSNNRNVCLWTKDTSGAQNWIIRQTDAGVKIFTALDSRYALNYYWSSGQGSPGNCDIYPEEGNDTDSCVVLSPVDEDADIYRIKLANYDLYLTAMGASDNSDVRWEPLADNDNTQSWKLQEFYPGGEGATSSKVLTMPAGICCNWNQKHPRVTQLFGESACTLVAGLDVANFFADNGVGYEPEDMEGSVYWVPEGFTWLIPGPGRIGSATPNYSTSPAAQIQARQCIREIIDEGHPAVIAMGPDGDHSHTVMCYGYNNNAASDADLLVYDPANLDRTSLTGRVTTLDDAMDYSSRFKIRNVRATYPD